MISASRAVAAARRQAATRTRVASLVTSSTRHGNQSAHKIANNFRQHNYHNQHRCFSALSSLNEPTLFSANSSAEDDALSNTDGVSASSLRSDVRTMGTLLGDAIALHHGEDILEKVEALRSMAKESRQQQQAEGRLDAMVQFVEKLSPEELVVISRAFAHFLGIANAAEAHERCRRLKMALSSEVNDYSPDNGGKVPAPIGALHANKRDSTAGVLSNLLYSDDGSTPTKDEIFQSLTSQTVEIVLTAHPTQVNRRTLLEKHSRVQKILNEADEVRSSKGTSYRQQLLDDALRREIASIWQTDEVSRVKPSPQSEAERGTLVIETVLWEVLPNF